MEPCTIFCKLCSEQTEMFSSRAKDLLGHPFWRNLGPPRTWWKEEQHSHLPVCPPSPRDPLGKDCWKLPPSLSVARSLGQASGEDVEKREALCCLLLGMQNGSTAMRTGRR